jgi:hypothetical protein
LTNNAKSIDFNNENFHIELIECEENICNIKKCEEEENQEILTFIDSDEDYMSQLSDVTMDDEELF